MELVESGRSLDRRRPVEMAVVVDNQVLDGRARRLQYLCSQALSAKESHMYRVKVHVDVHVRVQVTCNMYMYMYTIL